MGAAKGSIFRYADRVDMLLMLLGTLGSIGDGMQNPLTMLILSDVINDYGSGKNLTNDVVDKVIINLLNSLMYVFGHSNKNCTPSATNCCHHSWGLKSHLTPHVTVVWKSCMGNSNGNLSGVIPRGFVFESRLKWYLCFVGDCRHPEFTLRGWVRMVLL